MNPYTHVYEEKSVTALKILGICSVEYRLFVYIHITNHPDNA